VILLILDLVPRYSRPAVAKYAVKHDPEPLLFILVVDALQSLMDDRIGKKRKLTRDRTSSIIRYEDLAT
jgi:hypothetical protein